MTYLLNNYIYFENEQNQMYPVVFMYFKLMMHAFPQVLTMAILRSWSSKIPKHPLGVSPAIREFTLKISISECIQLDLCIANWMTPALLGVMSTPTVRRWSPIGNISHKTTPQATINQTYIGHWNIGRNGNGGVIWMFSKYANIYDRQHSPVKYYAPLSDLSI